MFSIKNKVFSSSIAFLLLIGLSVSCSPSSYTSTEGMYGGVVGGGLGAGLGAMFASQVGNYPQNIALNAAIGAGIGIVGGALLHEQGQELERQRELVTRQGELISANQKDIDILRQQLDNSISWGGNEVKPWNERYPAGDMPMPYQGRSSYTAPGSGK